MIKEKRHIVTGITPTGELTIANYIGCIKSLIDLQKNYKLIIFAANLHSITQISGDNPLRFSNSKELYKLTLDIIAIYYACGVDIEENICFIQSDVRAHSELAYILACGTTIGFLKRMTQFKDKSQKSKDSKSIPTGLLIYPTLMSADILLYSPKYVPVGKDQKQHIELCRDIAEFFNKNYGHMFEIPEPLITNSSTLINSLTEPEKKMSKSSSDKNSFISLFDNDDEIRNKIYKSKTDSENSVYYNKEKKPGISNLINIYSGISDISIKEIESKYKNKNYKEFKDDLIKELCTFNKKVKTRYDYIVSSNKLKKILNINSNIAAKIADKQLLKVKKMIGLSE